MIAIDTNVLLRHLLEDDELQSAKSHQIFESDEKIIITDLVLAETLWTLGGSKFRVSKSNLISVVESLLFAPNVVFEDDAVIWCALEDYRISNADFSDALIAHKAIKLSSNYDQLVAFYTFDSDALDLPVAVKP